MVFIQFPFQDRSHSKIETPAAFQKIFAFIPQNVIACFTLLVYKNNFIRKSLKFDKNLITFSEKADIF